MAISCGPLLLEEGIHDGQRFFFRVHAAADADQLSVVVLASQAGGFWGPGQCATRALYLVGCNLLTVAGAAEHDAQGTGIVDGTQCRLNAKSWVIILSVVNVCATIDDVVALLLQVFNDDVLHLEPCVVCS